MYSFLFELSLLILFLTNSIPYKLKINLKKSSCMVGDYLKKAGVELQGRKHGFHSLRFSFSSMLFKENVDLYSISSILGHRDIKTTLLYIDVDTTKLKELALEVPIC